MKLLHVVLSSLLIACGSSPPPVAVGPSPQQQASQDALTAANQRVVQLEQKVAMLQTEVERVAAQAQAATSAAAQANQPSVAAAKAPVPPRRRQEPDKAAVYAVPIGNSPQQGPADALVTIVRAYEYACPFCEKSRATMEELQKKYGRQLRIVHKPLVVHPANATAPALAACAAHRQGKWRAMDELIWEQIFKKRAYDSKDNNQDGIGDCWSNGSCQNLNGLAKALKLNMASFYQDMKTGCFQEMEDEMRILQQQFGLAATPSFFINGRYLSGAQPVEMFASLIDEELKKAKAAVKRGVAPADYYQRNVMDAGLTSLVAVPSMPTATP